MNILSVLVPLIIIGVLLWAVNTIVPMEPWIKQVVNVIAVVCIVIWLLQVFVGPTGMAPLHPR